MGEAYETINEEDDEMSGSWLYDWARRDHWRAGLATREPEYSRRFDPAIGPVIEGGVIPGMRIENPENLPVPQPEKLVRCKCITAFCVQAGVDAMPGQLIQLRASRAKRLAAQQMVELVPDELDARVAAVMKKAERRVRFETAAALAAGPPPAMVAPVEAPAPVSAEVVRMRALRSFSLGGGRDLSIGDVFECDEASAVYRIARGLAEIVEPPGAVEAASASAGGAQRAAR